MISLTDKLCDYVFRFVRLFAVRLYSKDSNAVFAFVNYVNCQAQYK